MAEILSPIQPKDNGLAFNDLEISLIKKLFAGNDKMLMAVRNHMLQFELTEEEKGLLSTLSPDAIQFLRDRVFVPRANRLSKLQKIGDAWGSLQVNNMGAEEAYLHFLAREGQIAFYNQQLDMLNGDVPTKTIKLNDYVSDISNKTPQDAYVGFVIRNTILLQTDYHMNLLKTFAGRDDESVEEVKKRLSKDSAE